MKKPLRTILFTYIAIFSLQTLTLEPKKDFVVIEQITNGDLNEEEAVFITSFIEAYKNISLEKLGWPDKYSPLKAGFDVERQALHNNPRVYIFNAKIGEKVVGFISFEETENAGEIYIRQLAIHPDFKKCGIGTKLVALCQTKIPDTKKVVVCTRFVNKEGLFFYEKIGFTKTDTVPHGLSQKYYQGFKKDITS